MSEVQTAELLIELGCEDLPARFLTSLAQALAQGVIESLDRLGVPHREGRTFATPRRIAVSLAGVHVRQGNRLLERRGPSLAAAFQNGQPTPAASGFARSCGVDVKTLDRDSGYLVFRTKEKGRRTEVLVPEVFESALQRMDALIPKRMRWGNGEETFVRPVQWIVVLLGNRVIPVRRFGLISGRKTYGHRFHAPRAILLRAPEDYEKALRQAKVWADFESRRKVIRDRVESAARASGGVARITDNLLDEVTALVEWPNVITGRIAQHFLQLPPEIIVAAIETNQRYFTLFDQANRLLPAFIAVSNIESKDIAQVVAGNERVVRPRLADALFFWQQDRKQRLAAYGNRLAGMSYHDVLGNMAERVHRIQTLGRYVAEMIREDAPLIERAAMLCKCDLATRMVGEFPELQGVIGGHYARADGEACKVAAAIAEHYLPSQQGAPIPVSGTGRCLALADKLDALAGIFAIGQKPTSNKDPYALRRSALGVLRICIEGELDFDLRQCLAEALRLQPAGQRDDQTLEALWDFVMERLRGFVLDRGFTTEQFEAVRAVGCSRPLDFERRLQALRRFAGSTVAESLSAAGKRARNILRQACFAGGKVDQSRLVHPAEEMLAKAIDAAELDLASLRQHGNYDGMLARLAALKAPVDGFFDGVLVMDEDPLLRGNRLALLARLDALCREVADLSQLPGV